MKLGTAPGFVHIASPPVFGYRQTATSISKDGLKTTDGIRQMVLFERAGKYPGGLARRKERWEVLTRHLRASTFGSLRAGDIKSAWWLYKKSLRWHVRLGRLRFLLAVPLLCLAGRLKHQPAEVRIFK